jgi:hypothetical protein
MDGRAHRWAERIQNGEKSRGGGALLMAVAVSLSRGWIKSVWGIGSVGRQSKFWRKGIITPIECR